MKPLIPLISPFKGWTSIKETRWKVLNLKVPREKVNQPIETRIEICLLQDNWLRSHYIQQFGLINLSHGKQIFCKILAAWRLGMEGTLVYKKHTLA
jgi:hypothetical protein